MKRLLVFIGEGGCGKTTLVKKLSQEYPDQFRRVVTCTSRPKRIGETEGVDYHFRSGEYFVDNPELVLIGKTRDGFFYGTRRSDLFSDTHHLLLTSKITGIQKLVNLGLSNIIVVRISIDEELKISRMRRRGDTEEAILRRVQSDVESREEVDLGQVSIIDLNAAQGINEKIDFLTKRVGV